MAVDPMDIRKRKLSPRERREQEKAKNQARFKAKESARKAAMEACLERERQQAQQKAIEKLAASVEKEPSVVRKSMAKAAGLKSTFILNQNSLLMTSFGKGNAAKPEKQITDGQVTPISADPAFSTRLLSHQFEISGRLSAVSDDPLHSGQGARTAIRREKDSGQGIGQSVGFLRESLEKKFYGQTFADNIHIQLIYNILDIEKLLAAHINHICYEINNLFRDALPEDRDFVGYLSLNVPYDAFRAGSAENAKAAGNNKVSCEYFDYLMENVKQTQYFPSAFSDWMYIPADVGPKNMAAQKYWNRWNNYYRLCLLGMTRQAMSHENFSAVKNIYMLDAKYDARFDSEPLRKAARAEARKMLDVLYGSRVRELNDNFLSFAKRDLVILFDAYRITEKSAKAELLRNYYRFTVRKEFKNLGFSIKRLREILLMHIGEQEHLDIKGKKYDSVRHKMYKLFDFVLFQYYCTHSDVQAELVSNLRSTTSEAEKETVYIKAAVNLWPEIRNVFLDGVLPQMNGKSISEIKKEDPDISAKMLTEQIGENAHTFSKLIYLLTLYLDGKEINDLLTGLINKLENIQSFQSILEWQGLPCRLADVFSIFEKSGEIAAELRIVNSFARMEKKAGANAKKVMFMEAAQVLGDSRSKAELSAYFDGLLDQSNRPLLRNGKRDNRFRNFICNNVIDTPRFRYLVRYADPKSVREIIRNRAVVKLVLNDIPDAQIASYYETCTGVNEKFFDGMRDTLADKLTNITFLEFEHAKSGNSLSEQEKQENERMKGLIRLYLTVLYLVVKNLVYINARYTLAFHCLERDYNLIHEKPIKDSKYLDLTREAIEQKRLNHHSAQYIQQNLNNADIRLIRDYRNKVTHLNTVRNAAKYIGDLREANSYFEIYHYLMQRSLQESCRNEDRALKTQEYFAALDKYHTYCKDFVKALNTPFGYNLPRYKNLSIDGLFDRNRPGEGQKENRLIQE